MKRVILVLAILATIVAGCHTEPMTEQMSSDKVTAFEASTEVFSSHTKTTMTSDKKIVWSADDEIAIFQGSTLADRYVVSESGVGQSNAIFNMVNDNSSVNGSFSAGTELPCNVALYPYFDGLTLSGAVLESENVTYSIDGVVLPEAQTYVAESFGEDTFLIVSVTANLADHNLKFKNVLGAMKLQCKGTPTVKSIKIAGKNNEILSGEATITAYANNLTPAVSMTGTDDAAKSVILTCGDGVQLSEYEVTDFIIVLPPVLFSKGFTVTVTDDTSQTYIIETDKTNAVLRSSILTMPTIVLGDEVTKDEGDNNGDNIEYIVEAIKLNKTSLTLAPGTSYLLTTKVVPTNATDTTLTWSSNSPIIATVNESGVVTAVSDGTATITAIAVGGASESCTIKVISIPTYEAIHDYVDEYGVNHGKGIAIGGTVWAPINCGYKAPTYDEDNNVIDNGFPYGKLYQWGRKYGQGYSIDYDSSVPTMEEGPVSKAYGQSKVMSNYFFTSSSDDWVSTKEDDMWNSGNEEYPVKTDNDPCPKGWRVPTDGELKALITDYSDWTTYNDQKGYYFSGVSTEKYDTHPLGENKPRVFLSVAGSRDEEGAAGNRGIDGFYWSSETHYLCLTSSSASRHYYGRRVNGFSVRCVQE